MATISGYDSSSIGVLFSSLNGSSSSSSASSNYLGINLGDYAAIRNGSYYKLMKAYYGINASDEVKSAASDLVKSTSTSSDDTETLAGVESAAESMSDSADALLETGSKSLFNQVTTTDEEGNTTTDYDRDAIYKAVSQFVDDYNSLIAKASSSSTKSINRTASSMANYTKINETALGKVGITVGSDGKLSIDKDDFMDADMSSVKNLFNNKGSYGYQISAQASLANTYAQSEATKANTYGSSGSYTYNYTTGQLYSSTI